MKTKIFCIALMVNATAFAAPTPLTKDVPLKNAKFSQKIYEALEKKLSVGKTTTSSKTVYSVGIPNLINCDKVVSSNGKTTHGCTLSKNGWRSMGMEVYGSGFKQDLTKALYNALSLKAVNEDGINFKKIELDVPDRDGGTERNLLVCTRMSKEVEEMGFRDSCEVMNGL